MSNNKEKLGHVILQQLSRYDRDRQHPILCPDLINEIWNEYKVQVKPEEVRGAVNAMRKSGFMIGSSSGKSPKGYYMINNQQELDEFINDELGARLADLSRTIEAMKISAKVTFADVYQMSLLGRS
jgi:hypothetical protein